MGDIVSDLRQLTVGRRLGPIEPTIFRAADYIEFQTAEIERLRRVEEDHKNVLKAALYLEPNGIDLVNRLTTYALRERASATAQFVPPQE